MEYVDAAGNAFELPKYTLALNEKITSASTGNDAETFKKRYEILKEVLPAEYLNEALDGATVSEIDLVMLNRIFADVKNAYEMPVVREQIQSVTEMLQQMTPALDKIKAIQDNGGGKPNRQGFNRIK